MSDSERGKTKKNRDFTAFSGAYSNLILTGLSGSGKTVIGQSLAQFIGWGFLDLDGFIHKITGKTPEGLIHSESIDSFREYEREAVTSLKFLKNHVISLGGGTFCDKRNLMVLRKLGFVVWLDVAPKTIGNRLTRFPEELEKRPLLRKKFPRKTLPSSEELKNALELLLEVRAPYYEQAHLIVRDNYSSSDIYARKVYRSILGF